MFKGPAAGEEFSTEIKKKPRLGIRDLKTDHFKKIGLLSLVRSFERSEMMKSVKKL